MIQMTESPATVTTMRAEQEILTLDEYIGMTTTTTTADGTTIWNCRPYIGYTNLEKFDEKASRDNRVN
ncbi:hypothetical protein PHMEG_00038403 [Phytophthora megakarya]|uniref:Uncharacterized protein n=1 Tax=Phytophthora megakarya TaxID=4795 RepID=A0A225UHM1_9STRA|nr:hypothetical protein PHMEG_00038403 [Phytophthora megakarya]